MNHRITSQSVVAYSQCPRKAFFILRGEPKARHHEYEQVLEERASANRSKYRAGLSSNELVTSEHGANGLGDSTLVCADDLVATCDALVKKDSAAIDHCSTCPFRVRCLHEAEETDNLTLLDRMTPKLASRYVKKGVFTVNQLSYLFKPRRYRKRSGAAQPSFNIELQALPYASVCQDRRPLVLGGVIPRIIIQEEEEETLGISLN